MNGRVGLDSHTMLIQAVAVTAANTTEGRLVGELLHGEQTRLWGDTANHCRRDAIAAAAPAARNHTNYKDHRHRPLSEDQESANRYKSSLRPKVEHPIGPIERVFGFRMVRHRRSPRTPTGCSSPPHF